MKKAIVSLAVLAVVARAAGDRGFAGNWPRFRGPNGTGIATDKDIPVKWAKENLLWKTPLPGAGNSSPVVWGKHLFLQSATAKERLLLCVSVTDGKILWKKSVKGGRATKHPKNSFASSTPATDGKQVYALFWDGSHVTLYAYTVNGKYVWKRDLGEFDSQHGPGASPVLVKEKVVLNNDQDGAAELIALKAKDGKLAWRSKRPPFRACYSTPLLRQGDNGKPELIVASTAGITGYNPDNGKENWNWAWHFTGIALRTVGSPVYGHGIVFVGSGDGSGERHMVAVKAGGKGEVTKTNLVWQKKREFPYVPSMLLSGDYLFYVNDHGKAGCVVAKTGKPVWSERLPGQVSASPVLVNGKIYVVSEKGDVFVFAAAAKYKRLAKNELGEGVLASPAVADNRLFIRGQKHLFCIGKPKGK
jgi:outer membrane protein assembly factor BamB